MRRREDVGKSSVTRRRRSANGSAAQATDDGARERIAGRRANQRTATGADGAAGQRALSGSIAAGGGRQRQCGPDGEICDSRHELLLVPGAPITTKKSTYSSFTTLTVRASPMHTASPVAARPQSSSRRRHKFAALHRLSP